MLTDDGSTYVYSLLNEGEYDSRGEEEPDEPIKESNITYHTMVDIPLPNLMRVVGKN